MFEAGETMMRVTIEADGRWECSGIAALSREETRIQHVPGFKYLAGVPKATGVFWTLGTT